MSIIIMRLCGNSNKNIINNYKDIEKMQINITKKHKEIKAHGNFEFPVGVNVEAIQAYEQGAFLWHWHPEIELTWIMSGQIDYHVNDRQYILTEGEGLFGNCNTLHSGYMKDGQECTYLSVTFHPRFLYGYENSVLQTKYVDFITSNTIWPSLKLEKDVKWHQEIIGKLKDIYHMTKCPPGDYELEMHLMLVQIWQKLYRYFASLPRGARKPQKYIERIRDIVTYVQEHYNEEITLDDVAGHVNICKSECCRFFKKHMGMTIFEYIMFLRIQNSLPLLREGESITKTAAYAGFSSPAYYGQIFKRYMKCTPKEYQKEAVASALSTTASTNISRN